MKESGFPKRAEEMLRAAFEQFGYKKRRSGILTFTISATTLGWVGLNRAYDRADRVLEMNPVVGIRDQRVERIVAHLLEQPFNSLIPPTISRSLGYLMPNKCYTPFYMRDDSTMKATIMELIDNVESFGKPFMFQNADLVKLLDSLMNKGHSIPGQTCFRVPVVLSLLARESEAKRYVSDEVKKIEGRVDPWSDRFRLFAQRFQEQAPEPE